jgi:hypothetical protein
MSESSERGSLGLPWGAAFPDSPAAYLLSFDSRPTMSPTAQPQLRTRTLTLELADPALPVFYAQLTQLRDSLLISVGAAPLPFGISQDFSCGMNVRCFACLTTIANRFVLTSTSRRNPSEARPQPHSPTHPQPRSPSLRNSVRSSMTSAPTDQLTRLLPQQIATSRKSSFRSTWHRWRVKAEMPITSSCRWNEHWSRNWIRS